MKNGAGRLVPSGTSAGSCQSPTSASECWRWSGSWSPVTAASAWKPAHTRDAARQRHGLRSRRGSWLRPAHVAAESACTEHTSRCALHPGNFRLRGHSSPGARRPLEMRAMPLVAEDRAGGCADLAGHHGDIARRHGRALDAQGGGRHEGRGRRETQSEDDAAHL
eukprot:scaffold12232_cov129-Isochrysis_galbana.AAC.2